MSLQVKYMDIPVGAQEVAEATVSSLQPFGTPQQLTTGAEDIPWATLEPGGWALDGMGELLPNTPTHIGWWSQERSDGEGLFASVPTITVCFPQPYTATGLTFVFWPSLGHWCSRIHVAWYCADTLLSEITACPDDTTWILHHAVEGFDRIVLQVLQTNLPGQFAKLSQLQIGHVVVFEQGEIVRVGLLNETDPSACELSVDTMTVEIQDRKGRALLPQKNQPIHLYRNQERIATHYIADSSRQAQQSYVFQSQSVIGQLEDTFLGGMYVSRETESLLQEILEEFSFQLDERLKNTVTGYLPVCTRREALQQVALAIGGVVTTNGDGVICLVPPEETVKGTFDGSSIFTGAKVSREAQIAAVQVFAHSYRPGNEEKTLLNGEEVFGEDVLFVFSEPHHSYAITGGTLMGSGANWVRITANGPVELKAKPFIHSTSVRTRINASATATEKSNVVTVENATLIHGDNVQAVLDRLYEFNLRRHVLTQDVVVAGHRVGDLVHSPNPWGTQTEGFITCMESAFSGKGHTAQITIRGREVQP